MTIQRDVCNPSLVKTNQSLIVDGETDSVCVDGAGVIVTLPTSPKHGRVVCVSADATDVTVVGGRFPLIDEPHVVTQGTTCCFVFDCNDQWLPETCASVGPTGPTGPSGPVTPGFLSVPNIAALVALDASSFLEGQPVYVQTLLNTFDFQPSSTLTVDGITVVPTTVGGASRWIRTRQPDPSWARQDNWFIDPVGGNDENAGDTALTALKTYTELNRRWGPLSTIAFTSDPNSWITVTLLGDLPITDPVSAHVVIGGNSALRHIGTVTQVRAGSFTGVTVRDTDTNQPWEVTDGAMVGTWTTDLFTRLRITTPGPNFGAIAWVLKDLGAKTARTTEWVILGDQTSYDTSTTPITPSPGDAYVVETLSSCYFGELYTGSTAEDDFSFANLVDLRVLTIDGDKTSAILLTNFAVLVAYGCRFDAQIQVHNASSGFQALSCLFTGGFDFPASFADLAAGGVVTTSDININYAVPGSHLNLQFNILFQTGSLKILDGSNVNIGSAGFFDIVPTTGSEHSNPDGDGLIIANSVLGATGRGIGTVTFLPLNASSVALWGKDNAGVGLRLNSVSRLVYDPTTKFPTLTGVGGDFRCGNTVLGLATVDPATGIVGAPVNQTWANLAAARPGGFGTSAVNPTNLAAIVPIVS